MINPNPTTHKRYHPHPVYILSNLGRYLFLLLIPIVRGLFHVIKSGFSLENGFHLAGVFASWVQGAWLDLLSVLLLIGTSILVWYLFTIDSDETGLTIKKGIFRRFSFFLPSDRFTCITITRPFYMMPFGGVYLRIDTPGGSVQNADLIVLLRNRDCEAILHQCLPKQPRSSDAFRSYRPRNLYVFVLAAITSNSFAGILLITTFLTQIGNVLGNQFSDMLYGTFEDVAKTLAFGIPPAAAAIAYILFFGYLCAFVANLFRHANFAVRRRPSRLEIRAGLVTNRTYLLETGKITYMDIRQTLITAFLGLSSVFLNTVGYGKYKDDVSALIPCATKRQLTTALRLLLPEFQKSPRKVTPHLRSAFRYTANSLFCCGGAIVGAVILTWLIPDWADLIKWVAFICFCPSLWFLAVRVLDLFTAGVSFQDGYFTLRYSKGFTLHTVVIPQGKVAEIRTTQSIFQKWNNRCNLYLYSYTEGIRVHQVRDLDQTETEALFQVNSDRATQPHRKLFQRKKGK